MNPTRSPLSTPELRQLQRDAINAKLASDLLKVHEQLLQAVADHKGIVEEARTTTSNTDEQIKTASAVFDGIQERAAAIEEQIIGIRDEIARIDQLSEGKPGETPSDERLVSLIKPLIPEPVKGDSGETPTPTFLLSLIKPLIPKTRAIVAEVLSQIRQPKDGETPVIDHEQLANDVLENIISGKKLTHKDIAGLQEELSSYRQQMAWKQAGQHGGGDTIAAGSNITLTRNANGTTTIAASGGGASSPLTPTGTVNASNTVFGVVSQPSSVIVDGITYFEGFGYSYAALNITMDIAPSQYIRYYA